ncbi:MAG: sulfurtransferase complex subunit TusD, partial [Gammaproteobacteria bacterium]|nr:sulfurtransferase complex subunit TusD [Gammaproteobacteria bacterium]
MNFALNIQGSPYTSNSLWSALHFAQACLNEGHCIHRVFFYHDAVLVANALQAPPQDEMNLTTAWQTLGQNFELDLCLCVASCLRRGILND